MPRGFPLARNAQDGRGASRQHSGSGARPSPLEKKITDLKGIPGVNCDVGAPGEVGVTCATGVSGLVDSVDDAGVLVSTNPPSPLDSIPSRWVATCPPGLGHTSSYIRLCITPGTPVHALASPTIPRVDWLAMLSWGHLPYPMTAPRLGWPQNCGACRPLQVGERTL